MLNKNVYSILLTSSLILSTTTADAALHSRLNGQAVYDDVADLTWLADANAAQGSIYDTAFGDGRLNFVQASTWIADLNINGVTGWRLPTTVQPDFSCSRQSNTGDYFFGSNCRGSEMGNLFYNVLGGQASSNISDVHNSNFDLFSNIQDEFYWSSSFRPNSTDNAIGLYFLSGFQNHNNQNRPSYVWAVHSGDVSAVPLPAAAWLFITGLLGLVGFSRVKR